MVQVLVVEVMVIVIVIVSVVEANADGANVSASVLYMVSVLIVLLGILRPGADVADVPLISVPFPSMPMIISAFGEILGNAIRADGAGPPLSGTHYGLQRPCGARVRKRSATRLCAAQRPTDCRLGL